MKNWLSGRRLLPSHAVDAAPSGAASTECTGSAATAVRVDQLVVSMGGKTVVDGVCVAVAAGSTTFVIGPNGSGKSSLLKAVYRSLPPEQGSIWIGSDSVWETSVRKNAQLRAVVPQYVPIVSGFSVREIVAQGLFAHDSVLAFGDPSRHTEVDHAMHMVGIEHIAEQDIGQLSGGERQRVFVARALAQQTGVIVLDEPTNHLDVRSQYQLLEVLEKLTVTVIAAVHSLEHVTSYAEHVILLQNGTIFAQGTVDKVMTPANIRTVFGVDAHVMRHPITGRRTLLTSPISAED